MHRACPRVTRGRLGTLRDAPPGPGRSDPQLQTLTESSRRPSASVKAIEPQVPWRELAGFRDVIVHGYLGMGLAAVDRMLAASGDRTPARQSSKS